MAKTLLVFDENHAKKNVKCLGFSKSINNHSHLSRCE